MATNIEIIKKACEGSAYWRVEGIPSLTQILDEARADERAKVQSGKLTEVGQSLYDRRKHIEAHTAKQLFAELAECQIDISRLSPEEVIKAIQREPDVYWYWVLNGDKVDAIKKKYEVD